MKKPVLFILTVTVFLRSSGQDTLHQDNFEGKLDSLINKIDNVESAIATLEEKTSEVAAHQKTLFGLPLNFGIGVARTELMQTALRLLIESTQSIENYQQYRYNSSAHKGWYFTVSPDIKIESGTSDVLNAIIVKLDGSFGLFPVSESTGSEGNIIYQPKPLAPVWVFPVKAGIETNNQFNNLNVLAEGGIVPIYQGLLPKNPLLRKSKVGIFVQGGYKFKLNNSTGTGGQEDESKEEPNDKIFRVKGNLSLSPEIILDKSSGLGIAAIADGTGWFDMINGKIYYEFAASIRVIVMKGKSIDLTYQKGSGAPNFNTGDQFSANLKISF